MKQKSYTFEASANMSRYQSGKLDCGEYKRDKRQSTCIAPEIKNENDLAGGKTHAGANTTPSIQLSNTGHFPHPQQQYPPILCGFYPPTPHLYSQLPAHPNHFLENTPTRNVSQYTDYFNPQFLFSQFNISDAQSSNTKSQIVNNIEPKFPPIWHQNFDSYGMRLNTAPHVWSSVVQDSLSIHDQTSQSLTLSSVNNTCKVENVNPTSLPTCKNETSVQFTYSSTQSGHDTHDSYVDVDTCNDDKKQSGQTSETKQEPFKSAIAPLKPRGSPTPLSSDFKEMTNSKTDTAPTANKSGANLRHSCTFNNPNIGSVPTNTNKNSPAVSRPSSV